MAFRLSLDPRRVVAIDSSGLERRFLTVMTPPVASRPLHLVVDWLRTRLRGGGGHRRLAGVRRTAHPCDDRESCKRNGADRRRLARGHRDGDAARPELSTRSARDGKPRRRCARAPQPPEPAVWDRFRPARRGARLGVGLAMITPPLVQDKRTSHINYSIDADRT
jgi:hypothetical protein